jgi:hypothetical protein
MANHQARDGQVVVQPPLPQVVGYVIVVVLGLVIALGMSMSLPRG